MKDELKSMQDEFQQPFHERAKALKAKTTVSSKKIAEECGISESTMSRYLSGSAVPPEDTARKILAYLEKNVVNHPHHEHEGEDMQAAFEMIKSVYEGRVSDLWKTISAAKRDKFALFTLVCVLMAIIIYLVFDGMNAGWGLFQPRA